MVVFVFAYLYLIFDVYFRTLICKYTNCPINLQVTWVPQSHRPVYVTQLDNNENGIRTQDSSKMLHANVYLSHGVRMWFGYRIVIDDMYYDGNGIFYLSG